MSGIRALAVSDDNHGLIFRGQKLRFLLPAGSRPTYCIKNLNICTLFFCRFQTGIPDLPGGGRLRDQSQRHFPARRLLTEPLGKGRRAVQHDRMRAPAGDGAYLRVIRRADDHALSPPPLRLHHNLVDPGHIGAGGVHNPGARALQRLVHRPALPVGPDDHRLAGSGLFRRPDAHRAQFLHAADDLIVVDQMAQHGAAGALLRRPDRQLHRTAHAVAEPGAPGKLHFQFDCSFSEAIRSMSCAVTRS